MLDPKEIGRRIAGIRELKHMTLEDVASRVHVSRSTILRYERGDFERIKLPVLLSIANALGVPPEYLSVQEDDDGLSSALNDYKNASCHKDIIEASSNEIRLIELYRNLNPEGQENLLNYADYLISSGRYIKTDAFGLVQENS